MQALAIIVPALCVILGTVLLLKFPPSRNRTFSEHVADNRTAFIIFMTVFPVLTVMYYYFLAVWFGPTMGMPDIYYIILMIAGVSQLIMTYLPAKGKLVRWHTGFALVVTTVMMLIALLLLINAVGRGDVIKGVATSVYLCASVTIFISYFLRRRLDFVRRNLLMLELIFFALFWAYVGAVTYL